MNKLWLFFINLSMLSERKGGNLKSKVVFFYNRQLCAVAVEFSVKETPQNEKDSEQKNPKNIIQWGKSGMFNSNISVFYVCICNLRLNTLWIMLKT